MTVTCRWTDACDWGVQRDHEADCWAVLYAHLLKVHGHDVHAETSTPQQDSRGPVRYAGGTTETARAGNPGLTPSGTSGKG